jgi:hypothetical protein
MVLTDGGRARGDRARVAAKSRIMRDIFSGKWLLSKKASGIGGWRGKILGWKELHDAGM